MMMGGGRPGAALCKMGVQKRMGGRADTECYMRNARR